MLETTERKLLTPIAEPDIWAAPSIARDKYHLGNFANQPIWVAWRNEERRNGKGDAKLTKVPYCGVYAKAKSDDPSTWVTLDQAYEISGHILVNGKTGGIGIIIGAEIAEGLALGGIDLDSCVGSGLGGKEPGNPGRNKLTNWAAQVIARFNSYTEVSPSGSGIKIFFLYPTADFERMQRELFQGKLGRQAKIHTGDDHPPGIEVYLGRRYFAVTGDTERTIETGETESYPDAIRTISYEDLEWLIRELMPTLQTRGCAKSSTGSSAATPNSTHKDNSRSGIAFHRVKEWRRTAQVETQAEMARMLLSDPDTQEWARQYEEESGQRQFTRLWENTKLEPGSVDEIIAEIAREFRNEGKTEKPSASEQEDRLKNPAIGGGNANCEPTPLILDETAPAESGSKFLDQCQKRLIHWRGDFYEWAGTHYREADKDEIDAQLYTFFNSAVTIKGGKFRANRNRIADTKDALRALTRIPAAYEPKAHLRDGTTNGSVISFANGILDLQTDTLYPHRDDLLILNSLPFDHQTGVTEPAEWLHFLHSIWPHEPEYLEYLQEILGYLVSGRTDLHKLFMVQGPPRCGKGTIAAVMRGLLGSSNVTAIPLARLAEQFALQSAIGKSAIIIGDARLPSRTDLGRLTEILLNISGQDPMAIPRKYRDDWIGALATRIVIMSNLSPRLVDESAAIATRIIPVVIEESFLGREDLDLGSRLKKELPVIMTWALQGLRRLTERGRFNIPESAQVLIREAREAASPISAFVDERCICAPDASVMTKSLYQQYELWCHDNGHHPSSKAKFGMDLRALKPRLRQTRPGTFGTRERHWEGIRLAYATHGEE